MAATPDRDAVLNALRVVNDPDLRRDIVSLGFVKDLSLKDGHVSFTIELTTPACPVKDQMREQATAAVRALPGVTIGRRADDGERALGVGAGNRPPAAARREERHCRRRGQGRRRQDHRRREPRARARQVRQPRRHSRRRHLRAERADHAGPVEQRSSRPTESRSFPPRSTASRSISMGFLTDDDAPVIWRGPMLHGAIQQFFRDVAWKDLDYLIVDMPPGTGDVALSLSQTVPVVGSIVVTTPQQVSLADTPSRGRACIRS